MEPADTAFPPTAVPASVHNLPLAITRMIGREDVVATLASRLRYRAALELAQRFHAWAAERPDPNDRLTGEGMIGVGANAVRAFETLVPDAAKPGAPVAKSACIRLVAAMLHRNTGIVAEKERVARFPRLTKGSSRRG